MHRVLANPTHYTLVVFLSETYALFLPLPRRLPALSRSQKELGKLSSAKDGFPGQFVCFLFSRYLTLSTCNQPLNSCTKACTHRHAHSHTQTRTLKHTHTYLCTHTHTCFCCSCKACCSASCCCWCCRCCSWSPWLPCVQVCLCFSVSVYVNVCVVCVSVCVYVCVCVHMCAYIYARVCVCLWVRVHVYMCVFMGVCACIYVCVHVYMCVFRAVKDQRGNSEAQKGYQKGHYFWCSLRRVGHNHTYIRIYGVYTIFLAGKLPYIRLYTVYIYGSDQACPYSTCPLIATLKLSTNV